jgi:hypothetical protein
MQNKNRGLISPGCLYGKINTMSLPVSSNSTLPAHNSYVYLFQVAQYNLTLWLIEENAKRLLAKPQSYHTPLRAPTGGHNPQ